MFKLCSYFTLMRENITLKKEAKELKAQIYDLKKSNQRLSSKKNLYKRKWQKGAK